MEEGIKTPKLDEAIEEFLPEPEEEIEEEPLEEEELPEYDDDE